MPSSNTFPTSNSHVMDQFLNKYSKHVITEPLSCHIVAIIINIYAGIHQLYILMGHNETSIYKSKTALCNYSSDTHSVKHL